MGDEDGVDWDLLAEVTDIRRAVELSCDELRARVKQAWGTMRRLDRALYPPGCPAPDDADEDLALKFPGVDELLDALSAIADINNGDL